MQALDQASALGPSVGSSAYDAGVELGKLGALYGLPPATIERLKAIAGRTQVTAFMFVDTANMGSGQIRTLEGDGAEIALLVLELERASAPVRRLQLLWACLNRPTVGDPVLEFCLERMCEIHSEDAIPYLTAAAAHCGATGSWMVRRRATTGLTRFLPASRGSLLLLTGSADAVVASIAQEALEDFVHAEMAVGAAQTVDALAPDLAHESWFTRFRAVASLGRVIDRKTIGPLLRALDDPDWLVRQAASTVLARLGDKRSIQPLSGVVTRDSCWLVRLGAVKALSQFGDSAPLPVFVGAMHDADARVRCESVIAAGQIGSTEAVRSVVPAMSDPEERVRLAALTVLGTDPSEAEVRRALMSALGDSSDSIKVQAAGILGTLGDREAVEPLKMMMDQSQHDDACWVREAALDALARIGGPRALESVRAALRDKQGSIRCKAIAALVSLGDVSDVEALRSIARSDEEESVRRAAHDAADQLMK